MPLKNPFKKDKFQVKSGGNDSYAKDVFSQKPEVQEVLHQIRKEQGAKHTPSNHEPSHMSRAALFGANASSPQADFLQELKGKLGHTSSASSIPHKEESHMTLGDMRAMLQQGATGGNSTGQSFYAELDFANPSKGSDQTGPLHAAEPTLYSGVSTAKAPEKAPLDPSVIYAKVDKSAFKNDMKAAAGSPTKAPDPMRYLKPQAVNTQHKGMKM